MDISFHIENKEDILFLQNYENVKRNRILQSALSIGLRSIQMSETNLDCKSYLNPIQEITNQTNTKIEIIDEKLNSFLHLQSNSSKKGEISENICRKLLAKKYPDWDFNDVSHESYSGDCRAIDSPIGEILYEFKNYDTNVNREQVTKFHRDLEYTGIQYGIFVSNTSGIVGKKNIEWEIIQNNKLIIYVSNIGYNGYGCIIGTELLLSLVHINVLDTTKMNYYHNYEIDLLKENLIELSDNYKHNLECLTKHKYLIKEQKQKINHCLDTLERSIFDIELEQKSIFQKIFHLMNDFKNEKLQLLTINDLSKYIDIFHISVQKIAKIYELNEFELFINDNNSQKEIFFQKNEIIYSFTRHMKSKIELVFPILDQTINLNLKYEKIKKNEIIIELKDNSLLYDFINDKIKEIYSNMK